ncbi:MAG: peptide deformylase [Bacteroidales bacterium]
MILPIYLYGSQVLREKAKEVEIDTPSQKEKLKSLIANMWETMEQAYGVGLAAPQIGQSIRVLVVDGAPLAEDMAELEGFKRVIINPVKLYESEEEIEYNEGCLSIPDVNAIISRPKKMRIKYLNENFEEVVEELDNFACRMVQHEMDHLDGILFTDLAPPIRKKMLSNKLSNIRAGKSNPDYKIKR